MVRVVRSGPRPAAASEVRVDARGLLCPLPVIRVQDAITGLAPGTRVRVLCTDPGALADIPAWCRVHGHEVLALDEAAKQYEHELVLEVGAGNGAGGARRW